MDENAIGWSPTAKLIQTHLFCTFFRVQKYVLWLWIRTYDEKKKTHLNPITIYTEQTV